MSDKKHFYKVPKRVVDMTDEERLEFCRQLWSRMVTDLTSDEEPAELADGSRDSIEE